MSEWTIGEIHPKGSGFVLVVRTVLQTTTDINHHSVYADEIAIIFFFKEPACTGWQKDWTGNPSYVKYWQSLPKIPEK